MNSRIFGLQIKVSVSIWFIVVIPLVIMYGYLVQYLVALVSIIFHEIGHALVAAYFRAYPFFVKITPLGLRILIREDHLFKKQKLAVDLAGPAVNLFLTGMLYAIISISLMEGTYFTGSDIDFLENALAINICLAVFNLFPIPPLDGGRTLQNILSGKIGLLKAAVCLKTISAILSAILILAGILGLTCTSNRLFFINMLFAGAYLMFLLSSVEEEASLMNIKQILFRKSRFQKKGIYAARDLVVLKSMRLVDVVKRMDYDMFHFIYVLDEDFKLLGIYSENDILECMINDSDINTFEDLVNIKGSGQILKKN